jgi:squalene-associated FAD-dependent desaturase
MRQPEVLVIGGGLAGLSAAIACADSGAQVTLVEARPRLGGLTWSFERHGLAFDNGQHVYLRCCTAYRGFLERIGTAGLAPLQPRLELPVLRPDPARGEASVAWIARSNWPAPLHLASSLLRYSHLRLADRLGLGRAVLPLMRARLGDPRLDTETLGHFLESHGQSEAAVTALWDLITLPTVNLPSAEASLELGAKVFQTGLFSDASAGDIGWSRVPLSELHGSPSMTALSERGADVRLSTKVTALQTTGSVVTAATTESGQIAADAVILAVAHDVAQRLLPPGAIEGQEDLHRLSFSPILNVHLVYDRPITEHMIAACIDSPVQFIFDRTEACGLGEHSAHSPSTPESSSRERAVSCSTQVGSSAPQCLAVSLSGAHERIGRRPHALIAEISAGLADLFPRARSARLLDAVVTREHTATFAGVPGTAALRPGTTTAFDNLALAGSWTATGWPATMEGAVRSGNAAAREILRAVARSGRQGDSPEEDVA